MQLGFQALRQHQHAVLATLALADDHRAVGEIDVLDPQLQAFGNAHPGAVKELCEQSVLAIERTKHRCQLFLRQHHGQPALHPRLADLLKPGQAMLQDLRIEKHQRRQRLPVRRGRHLALRRKPTEEGLYLSATHFRRVPDAMKADEGTHPVDVGLLGTAAVVQEPDTFAHLIEQPRRLQRWQRLHRMSLRPQRCKAWGIHHVYHTPSLPRLVPGLPCGHSQGKFESTRRRRFCRQIGTV